MLLIGMLNISSPDASTRSDLFEGPCAALAFTERHRDFTMGHVIMSAIVPVGLGATAPPSGTHFLGQTNPSNFAELRPVADSPPQKHHHPLSSLFRRTTTAKRQSANTVAMPTRTSKTRKQYVYDLDEPNCPPSDRGTGREIVVVETGAWLTRL
jgi:hypothetical protein